MGRKIIDLAGRKFGKLTVVAFDGRRNKKTYWKCKCDCGGERIVSADHLLNGDCTDCGCYRRHISHWQKHGMWDSRLYKIWSLMKERCFNSKRKEYKNYGGRGITVCQEWLESKNFIEWSLSNGYSDDLTLDRIDNDGDYCPENCRWVSRQIQSNNTRNCRMISYKGESKTLTQWAKENNLTYKLVQRRIDKLGWSFERAISQPLDISKSHRKE